MNAGKRKQGILIVDDNAQNLELLEIILQNEGFQVRPFNTAKAVLEGIVADLPDLMLLDINMPEMDGYELCKRLKAVPELAKIPVIFVSALSDVRDKKKGFQLGAVDYIAKPFDSDEVIMRVKNHLLIGGLQKQLEAHNQQLESLVAQRTAELVRVNERLSKLDEVKSDFLSFISHEIRTPLNGLIGVLDIILEELSDAVDDELQDMFDQSRLRILNLIDDALLLNQIESFPDDVKKNKVQLRELIALSTSKVTQSEKDLSVELGSLAPADYEIIGEKDLLIKAFGYLLSTAHKFCAAGNYVQVSTVISVDGAIVTILAEGKPIADKAIESFFDFYSDARSYTYAESMGLAPVVAGKILSLFDGSVTISKSKQEGVTFEIIFKSE